MKTLFLKLFIFMLSSVFHLSYANTLKEKNSYTELEPPLNLNVVGDKISIVEVFAYECSHCAELEPKFEAWASKNKDRIEVHRIPLSLSEQTKPLGNMYYALNFLADKPLEKDPHLNNKIFVEVQKNVRSLLQTEAQGNFLAKHNVNKQKYLEIYNNLSTHLLKKVAPYNYTYEGVDKNILDKFKINFVPVIVVDGKWLIKPQISHNPNINIFDQMLSTANKLVEKAIVEKNKSKLPK